MRHLALAALLFTAAPLAHADVLPPPEEITEVQKMLVGSWQQTAMDGYPGHGAGVETLYFDKERYVSVSMHVLTSSNMYSISQNSGEWTAEKTADGLKLTISHGGTPNEPIDVKFTGPDTMMISRMGRGPVTVTYTRTYPKTAP